MKTLYTAFKGKNNTSFQLASTSKGDCLLLTNSFQGIKRDISKLNSPYDVVIMLGVDKTLTDCIRFEGCAEYNGELIYSTLNLESITHKCDEMMIPYHISFKPTQYLCNAAYWHMLHKVSNTIFIHIPSTKGMNPTLMNLLIDLLTQSN